MHVTAMRTKFSEVTWKCDQVRFSQLLGTEAVLLTSSESSGLFTGKQSGASSVPTDHLEGRALMTVGT